MKRRSRNMSAAAAENGGEQGFWPSYADMMSSVALILFFLMLLSYIQNLVTGNDLQNTQEVLALTQSEVEDAQAQLSLLEKELDSNKKELALQLTTIEEQEELIGKQADYLLAANDELVAMRNQMQTIAVLRLSIVEKIQESIVSAMGDKSKVSIGDSGNLILNEGVLFDSGSYAVKDGSFAMLDDLSRVFANFLSDGENAKYVDSIVISGHTDTDGIPQENRTLSTNRANAVLDYLLTANGGKLNDFSQFFCSAGYGSTRPVKGNDTDEGKAANRRIEISIILKDETVLDIVEQYLALELPDTKSIKTDAVAPTPSAKPKA